MTWVRNRWYVAAWDAEVDRTPIARTLCGEPVMLYRKLDRSVVAMRDACPHRLLPLSMGFKEGDSVRCRYHGLLVGPDGHATQMPIKTEPVPKGLCATLYPVVEKHRFVWIWIGEAEKADPALVPDFWPCSAPGWTFDGGYNRVECDYRLMIDNLMDLSHETWVHQGSIGQHEITEAPIETVVEGEQVLVRRWMPGIEPPPFWRDALRSTGLVDRWQVCHFLPPSSVLIDVGVSPVEAGDTIERHDSGVRGFVVDAMTPETESSTHYFWGMARNFDIEDSGFTARFKAQQGRVFDEDVDVLEAQQRSIDANPDMKLRGYSIDEGSTRAPDHRAAEPGRGGVSGPIGRGDLDHNLGLRLRRAHSAVQRHFAEHFADLGLTQKQVSALWLTGDHPDLAQRDLAQAMDMDRATAMALVHGLEKRGLLSRSPSAIDGRRIAFRLTQAGAALLAEAKQAIAVHEAWLKGRFTAAELSTLEEMLARIYR